MKNWKKSDIGKIIAYKSSNESNLYEKVAICTVYPKNSKTIGVLDYPIALTSKFALLGLVKAQEKNDKFLMEKVGDWYFMGYASKEEKGVLEKIAKSPKILLD